MEEKERDRATLLHGVCAYSLSHLRHSCVVCVCGRELLPNTHEFDSRTCQLSVFLIVFLCVRIKCVE